MPDRSDPRRQAWGLHDAALARPTGGLGILLWRGQENDYSIQFHHALELSPAALSRLQIKSPAKRLPSNATPVAC